jgi:Flp pilus assembly pilin Flp
MLCFQKFGGRSHGVYRNSFGLRSNARETGLLLKGIDMRSEKSFVTGQEKGASLVEYALLVALIAIGAIAALQILRQNISSSFSQVGSGITSTGN